MDSGRRDLGSDADAPPRGDQEVSPRGEQPAAGSAHVDHARECADCRAWWTRQQRIARSLRGLARQAAPARLTELLAPEDLREARMRALLGGLSALRAPNVLDRLVGEELAGHPGTTARRFAGDLERKTAPPELQARIEAGLAQSGPDTARSEPDSAHGESDSTRADELKPDAAQAGSARRRFAKRGVEAPRRDPSRFDLSRLDLSRFDPSRDDLDQRADFEQLAPSRFALTRRRRNRVLAFAAIGLVAAAGWIGVLLFRSQAPAPRYRFDVVETADLAQLRQQNPIAFQFADGLSGGALRVELETEAAANEAAANEAAANEAAASAAKTPTPVKPPTAPLNAGNPLDSGSSSAGSPSTGGARPTGTQVSPGLVSMTPAPSVLAPTSPSGMSSALPPFVQLIEDASIALSRTAHQGTRSVHVFVNGTNAGVHHLVTNERVTTNGRGGFSIIPESAQGDLPMAEIDFLAQQAENASFYYRYRDFLIRDLALFQQNYMVIGAPTPSAVAGRQCIEFTVQRVLSPSSIGGTFTVDVDVDTAFVLAYEERGSDGLPVAKMRYDAISYAPDLQGVLFSTVPKPVVIDFAADPTTQLGFSPLRPSQVPSGYAQQIARVLEENAKKHWACFEYTDGIEQLFFLHGGSAPVAEVGPQGWTNPTFQTKSPFRMYVVTSGRWTIVHGVWQGQNVIAVGKLPSAALLEFVESALP